jgi:hypothetical protein
MLNQAKQSTMTTAKACFLLALFFALSLSSEAQVTGDSRTVTERRQPE